MKISILLALLLANFTFLSALDPDLKTTLGDNIGSISEMKNSNADSESMANHKIDRLKKGSTILKQGSLTHTTEFKIIDTVMTPSLKKNSLYATLAPGGYSIIGGYYERLLLHSPENIIKYVYGRIGAGGFAEFFGKQGFVYSGSVGGLIGAGKNHLEVYLGVASFYSYYEGLHHYFNTPLATAAYKYQKPEGHFVFRFGGGWPENVFISTGISF